MAAVLVVNAGSSSLKAAVFEAGVPVAQAAVAEIGGAAQLIVGGTAAPAEIADHGTALREILGVFGSDFDLACAGHRIVHGGDTFDRPARIDAAVLAEIEACAPLAPLHNPPALACIRALQTIAPDLPQVACFDTAFHRTMPEVEQRYALPPEAEALGLKRYGFHGISYAALVAALPRVSGAPLPERVLACHLGNGASLCAIRAGRSVATTMGYSPLEGLTMGSRSGGIDANAVLRLVEAFGAEATGALLNRASGLAGLSGGHSDMRALAQAGTPEAAFAIAHFCHWAVRHAGAMVAAMGGLDAIAFTGGIGEHSPDIRARMCAGLGYLGVALDPEANARAATALHSDSSRVGVWRVPAEEEHLIAAQATACLGL